MTAEVVLTDAEKADLICDCDVSLAEDWCPMHAADGLDLWTEKPARSIIAAVERIVADRLAQAQTPTDTVEHGYGDEADCICGRNFPTVRGLREHLTKSRRPSWPLRCGSCGEPATTRVTLDSQSVPVCLRHYNVWRTPDYGQAPTDSGPYCTRCGRQWCDQHPNANRAPSAARDTITIPRPHVPHGRTHVTPEQADAEYLREASRRIGESRMFGSNLTATVARLCADAANALSPTAPDADQGDTTGGGA